MNIIQKIIYFVSSGYYKGKDGEFYVKEPFSMEGQEIVKHIKENHPEAYDAVIESMRKKE